MFLAAFQALTVFRKFIFRFSTLICILSAKEYCICLLYSTLVNSFSVFQPPFFHFLKTLRASLPS